MLFGPELVTKIQVRHTYAVQPGRGRPHVGHIRVTSVSVEPLSVVGDGDFRAEGFERVADFADYWERLHGGTSSWNEPVAVIRFEFAGRCPKCEEWVP